MTVILKLVSSLLHQRSSHLNVKLRMFTPSHQQECAQDVRKRYAAEAGCRQIQCWKHLVL